MSKRKFYNKYNGVKNINKYVKNLGFEFYSDYINSKHWKEYKNNVYKNKKNCCEICGSEKRLIVHHKTYERLGEEKILDTMIVCAKCHDAIHKLHRSGKNRFKCNLWMATNYYKFLIDNIRNDNIIRRNTNRRKQTMSHKEISIRNKRAEIIQKQEIEFNKRRQLKRENYV